MPLDRAALLAARTQVQTETVDVPELGTVTIRMLSARERLKLDPNAPGQEFTARLAFLALCDESGRSLFTDADWDAFNELPGAAIQQIAFAALRFNRLREEDLEDDRKKFGSAPRSDSPAA